MRVLLALVLVSACADQAAPYAPGLGSAPNEATSAVTNIFGDVVPVEVEPVMAEDATLFGNIGPVSVYGDARVHEAYVVADYAYIELRSGGTAGSLMHAIRINGIESLEPGHFVFFGDASAAGDVQVGGVGCSGVREGEWTYDRPMEQIDMQVTELNRNTLRIEVRSRLEAYFASDDASTIDATFTIRVTEAPAP